MTLGIFAMVGAEFLPVSLLTPISQGLEVSEGMAGQMVTVTAMTGLPASLLISVVSGRIDRRWVLAALTALMVLSNLIVATAPSLFIVLIARGLLGLSLGGFWALAAATVVRLVAKKDVPKALSILYFGVSGATVFAAPFGSLFGEILGWRGVFLAAAGLGAVALFIQIMTLPSMPAAVSVRLGAALAIARRPGVALGLIAILLVFAGHFAFFTYLRPFLETVTMVGPNGVTAILLLFGIGTFAGNSASSLLIRRSLRGTLAITPLALSMAAIWLAVLGGPVLSDAIVATLWGFLFGIVPVSWSTWLTRVLPDETESGGGLVIATTSLAITIGAAGGGLIFDNLGVRAAIVTAAILLFLAAVVAVRAPSGARGEARDQSLVRL
ncbi:MAG: MFS transporter [Sphingopyxis sp.]|nr:MFS transporter [Sphingopyxis sp.]